ncbi:MAG: DUF2510 domain-containing protein [Propionibacteriaceae bacterium]|nr:DUF2510 domain-containing protein [Propionibacteriaceae bacterium]
MSAPGWYPDPTGKQGALRYWDGTAWQQQPAIAAEPAGNRLWLWFIVAMVVIGALVAAFMLRPNGLATTVEDTNSARPTGSQWNEVAPSETPTNEQDPGSGEIVDCPKNSFEDRSEISADGRMYGGGLSFVAPGGWSWEKQPIQMPWLYDHNSTIRVITTGWMSNLSVGEVKRSEGFKDPRGTATQLMGCLASSGLYFGFSGREDLTNQSFTLDGHGGWRMTANVRVDNQGSIEGDVVDIIVLDLGDPEKLAVFISCATINNEGNLKEVQKAVDSLRAG